MWGNKKLRLESIKLQSGYETDLNPQTKTTTFLPHPHFFTKRRVD